MKPTELLICPVDFHGEKKGHPTFGCWTLKGTLPAVPNRSVRNTLQVSERLASLSEDLPDANHGGQIKVNFICPAQISPYPELPGIRAQHVANSWGNPWLFRLYVFLFHRHTQKMAGQNSREFCPVQLVQVDTQETWGNHAFAEFIKTCSTVAKLHRLSRYSSKPSGAFPFSFKDGTAVQTLPKWFPLLFGASETILQTLLGQPFRTVLIGSWRKLPGAQLRQLVPWAVT